MKKLGLVGGMGPESTIPNECAVLNMGYDTDYVDCLIEEMDISQVERKAFIYYSLLYCMDFMGEWGTQFGIKKLM